MGKISSINFQKTKISKSGYCFQLHHNSVIRPNYAIGGELICNHSADEAQILRDEIIANAKEIYQKNCKARNKNFQAKSYLWSAVCNIKPTTTMADLEKLSAHFKGKYGFQCYQIAIHRDEGHIDNGEKRINHHAHLEFITLDKETGKNQWKNINKIALSRIQDEVAQILQMERGEYVEITGAKHLSGRAYGAMKQREKAERKALNNELNKQKSLNKELNEVFDELDKELELPYQKTIADSAKSYISKIKKIKDRNAELEQQIEKLKLNAELENRKKQYDADREQLKQSGKATQQDYIDLKQEFESDNEKIKAKYKQNIAELKPKNAQNRDIADTSSAAPVQSKSTETTQGVEKTPMHDEIKNLDLDQVRKMFSQSQTEPKIDAPQQTPQQTSLDDDFYKKMAAMDEAHETEWERKQAETNLDMPKNDFDDDMDSHRRKKR